MKISIAVLGLTMVFAAGAAASAPLRVLPGSTCSFTVHVHRLGIPSDITGVNKNISGTVEVSDGGVAGHVTIDAAGFDTGIGLRNRDVRSSLKAKTSPAITFELKSLPGFDPARAAAQGQTLTAQGAFSVAGHGTDLQMPVFLSKVGQNWRVQGETLSGFKALQVSPPGIPLLLSADDALKLAIDLLVGE